MKNTVKYSKVVKFLQIIKLHKKKKKIPTQIFLNTVPISIMHIKASYKVYRKKH